MSSPPEACSLKVIEHPYTQAFPPFCQVLLLRTNKPASTQQLLSKNSFTGTFTGTFFLLRLAASYRSEISLRYAPSPTVEILPPALAAFQKAFPRVNVVLHDVSQRELV